MLICLVITNLNAIVTELLEEEVKHFSCFHHTVLLLCFKIIRTNSIHYFVMKIPDKRGL